MTVDRTEYIARAEEAAKLEFCQMGVRMDDTDHTWVEGRICKCCSEFHCGISNEELIILAAKQGIRADELAFGTEEERAEQHGHNTK